MTIRYSFDLDTFDFPTIQKWLSGTYWSPGITLERVMRGFRAASLVVGAFSEDRQIGVARALTDTTRFAYLSDVFVDDKFRGKGIAREMARQLISHELLSDVDCCYLLTLSAHGVYEPLGFNASDIQGNFMVRRKQSEVKRTPEAKNI